jgi:hypothetical protein
LREGHALWLPNGKEWAWNRRYRKLAQGAAARGRRIYDRSYCGLGPGRDGALVMSLRWDADGRDGSNVSGEFARLKNVSARTLRLGGWRFRDSALRDYRLPRGTTVRPGAVLRIHVGSGTRSGSDLFWGLRRPIFENPSHDRRSTGDGAYLFDPEGDLRASMVYPCRENCTHPYQGTIAIEPKWRGREHVTLRNVSGIAVDLDGLRLHSRPYSYGFGRDSVLLPGEAMRLSIKGDPADDTRLDKYWGETGAILNNGGDVVRLSTYDGIDVACAAYGSRVC